MLKKLAPFLLLVCLMSSCDKDDDITDSLAGFYGGKDSSASATQLIGVWSIFNVGFEGYISEVPISYEDCGRDFIVFSENSRYSEYLFQDSSCAYATNSFDWKLKSGIITLTDQLNQSDEWVITKLNNDQLIFKSKFDVDGDGEKDIVTLYLERYTPIEIDVITSTFRKNQDDAFENLISFTWEPYQGFNTFNRYEIYRSFGNSCNLASAELIKTIRDVTVSEFTDLTPPGETRLCYFLKVHTDQGLLGSSYGRDINTEYIRPTAVTLNQPTVVASNIQLSWLPSKDPYFSHYELAYSNYGAGTASGQQEYSVTIIEDINTTSYLDEAPPYLNDPYYVLYVHNIFGGRTTFYNSQVNSFREVDYKREEIINFKNIDSYAVDDDDPIVYFFGRESGPGYSTNMQRFNYKTNQTEAVANLVPKYGTSVPIKLINSGFGKEIIVEQGSDLAVYDAITLDYKYTMDTGVSGLYDFTYSDLGYWILLDSDNVFTFTRDNANFELVDSKPHYPNHQGTNNYKVFTLNNATVLVGHNNESNSYLYSLRADGALVQDQIVPIPFLSNWDKKTQYNATGNYIINFSRNRLYSTIDFSLLASFGQPYFSSGTSSNGKQIFGSNNDPDWQITSESIHSKEAVIYNRTTGQVTKVSTLGYPHVIFENSDGEIVSISSGLKKDGLHQNINDKADLFLEIIDVP